MLSSSFLHQVDLDCNQCVAHVTVDNQQVNVKIHYLPAFPKFMKSRISHLKLTPHTSTRSIIRCLYKALKGDWIVELDQSLLLRKLLLGNKKKQNTFIFSSQKEKFNYLQEQFSTVKEDHPNYQYYKVLMDFEVKESVVVQIACTPEVKSGERLTFICDNKEFSCEVPPLINQDQKFFSYEIDQIHLTRLKKWKRCVP